MHEMWLLSRCMQYVVNQGDSREISEG